MSAHQNQAHTEGDPTFSFGVYYLLFSAGDGDGGGGTMHSFFFPLKGRRKSDPTLPPQAKSGPNYTEVSAILPCDENMR